jgi:hypothetical protein
MIMKLDQIAIYVHSPEQAIEAAASYGLTMGDFGVQDVVTGDVRLGARVNAEAIDKGLTDKSTGFLRFNYDLGIELELLTYLDGPHWHQDDPRYKAREPFQSHVGFHMEPGEKVPSALAGCPIAQSMLTRTHTNTYLLEQGRTYEYLILDTRPITGFYSKFIWRIDHA